MKVQIKKPFKSFLSPENKKQKKQTGSAWNFLQPPIQLCRGTYIPYYAAIFCSSLFFKEYLNLQVRINKMVNKHTPDYHPSPSELTSRIYLLVFLWTAKGNISLSIYIFSQNCIPPWLWKIFKSIVLRLLESTFVSQKIESVHFYSCPQTTPSPRFLSSTSRQKEITHFPRTAYFESLFFPQQKRERIMELKKWPKLHLLGYLSQIYIHSTIFATF